LSKEITVHRIESYTVIFSVFDRLRPRLPGYPAMVTQKGMDETGEAMAGPFGRSVSAAHSLQPAAGSQPANGSHIQNDNYGD